MPGQAHQRQKRAIPWILAGFFTAVFKATNSILHYKPTSNIENAIKILGQTYPKLARDFLDFKTEMFSITKHNNNASENNTSKIVKLKKGLIHLINYLEIELVHTNHYESIGKAYKSYQTG